METEPEEVPSVLISAKALGLLVRGTQSCDSGLLYPDQDFADALEEAESALERWTNITPEKNQ